MARGFLRFLKRRTVDHTQPGPALAKPDAEHPVAVPEVSSLNAENPVMKIAILMRGPLRPTVASGLLRAQALAQEVIDNGHEPTVFFASWSQPGGAAAREVMDSALGLNTLFVEAPDDADILRYCNGLDVLPGGRKTKNVFLQYYLARLGVRLIHDIGKFDFIIHSRPDMDVRMGIHFPEWVSAELYSTIHHPVTGFTFINDQFAVATPKVMLAAWDYGDAKNLGSMIQKCFIPEEVLQQMFDVAGLSAKVPPLEIWQLDAARNQSL